MPTFTEANSTSGQRDQQAMVVSRPSAAFIQPHHDHQGPQINTHAETNNHALSGTTARFQILAMDEDVEMAEEDAGAQDTLLPNPFVQIFISKALSGAKVRVEDRVDSVAIEVVLPK